MHDTRDGLSGLKDIGTPGVTARCARRVGAVALRIGGLREWPLVVLWALVAAMVLWCAPALALSQRGHVFSFSYGAQGSREGQFSDPMGLAVNDRTGDVYVADRKNKRVVQLEPVVNVKGELSGEKYVRSFAVPTPSGVAVDDSTEASDLARGDVYVVGSSGKAVYRFSAEGVPLGKPLKTFVLQETRTKGKLEGIEGVAVDRTGSLFAYETDGSVVEFADGEPGEGTRIMETGFRGAPGLALDSEDDLFVGLLSEGGVPVVSKVERITGKVLIAPLDGEETTAVAVNTSEAPAHEVNELNDVYALNVGSIAQFAPEAGGVPGGLIQRFPSEGEEEADGGRRLQRGTGIAVNASTGTVFVTDAVSDDVDVFELEPVGAPNIEGLSVQGAPVPAVGARRLSAQVDPVGADTHYYFEYGTTSCAAMPPVCTRTPAADIGGGFGDREVSLELDDLPTGEYHYRVVAGNSSGVSESAERTFAVFDLPSGLPDGRAWEMVSPSEKHGAPIEALTREGGWILAAEDGHALTYVANGAITEEAQGNRSPEMQQVLSTRGPEGWRSQDISTPNSTEQGVSAGSAPEYQFFTPDLGLALVEPWATTVLAEPPLAAGVTQSTMYLRDNATGAYVPLVTEANVPTGTVFGGLIRFVSATPDLSHVVIKSGVALTGAPARPGLYEWAGGRLQFVSLLPGGMPALEPELGYRNVAAHAISNDGSRLIWTSREEEGLGQHLYMRDTVTGETIQLDAAQGVAEPQDGSARFQTATSDGSGVFFTDEQRLTPDSTASAEPLHEAADLYECEVREENGKLACRLSDLTVDHHKSGESGSVQGFVFGANEDGSSVYLVAQGVLAANSNGNGERAEAGKPNLYDLHYDGTEWARTFIARLSSEDSPEWEGGEHANSSYLTARVSPNGRYLAFMSAASPTGYDNEDATSKHIGERMDEEVYLYDAATGRLTCVSCDPTGARPPGVLDAVNSGEGLGLLVDRREIWVGHWLAGNIPGWTPQSNASALYQSRYLSDEGRLFFNSPADLVEQASNHKEDVYEYEPAGVGSCESPSGGCVALISSGDSTEESAFIEATPSGSDVFFLTAAQLLPQDTDKEFDIYDARVCTPASPCLTPPSPAPPSCSEADACRPVSPSQQSPIGASGSAAFSGPGNLAPFLTPKQEVKGVEASAKPLTLAQKLSKTLNACRKQHPKSKSKRKACEAHARRTYASKKHATPKKHTMGKKSSSRHASSRRQ